MKKTREAVLDVSYELTERDNVIDQLNRKIADLQRGLAAREQLTIIGGPFHGRVESFDRNLQNRSYGIVVPALQEGSTPPSYSSYSSYDDWRVQAAHHRIERIQTASGPRYIGIYEGTR